MLTEREIRACLESAQEKTHINAIAAERSTVRALATDLLATRAALRELVEAQDAIDAWVADDNLTDCESAPTEPLVKALDHARAILANVPTAPRTAPQRAETLPGGDSDGGGR